MRDRHQRETEHLTNTVSAAFIEMFTVIQCVDLNYSDMMEVSCHFT